MSDLTVAGAARQPGAARPPSAGLRAVHHLLVLALCALAVLGAIQALSRGLPRRVGLEIVDGPVALVLLALLAVGVLLGAAALAVRARAWLRGRWGDVGLGPFRVALVVLVACWAAFLLSGIAYQRIHAALAIGVAGTAYGAWSLTAALQAGSEPRKALRVLDFALFNLCLLPIGLEVALRVGASVRPSALLSRFNRDVEANIESARMQAGWLHLGFPLNSRGYNDVEFHPRRADEVRVVAIADSFGLGAVPYRYHYATVAEEVGSRPGRALTVDNVSVPGVGPDEYLRLLLTEGFEFEPDLIVVFVFVGNDVLVMLQDPPPSQLSLRSWLDRREILMRRVWIRIGKLRAERERLASEGGPIEGWGGMTLGRRVADEELLEVFPWLDDALLERPGMSQAAFRATEDYRARTVCDPAADPYPAFFQVLEQIVRGAGSTPLGVVLIPDEFQVEEPVWQDVLADAGGIALERDRPQRVITAWLEREGVPYEDLLPSLRAVEPLSDGRRHVYHRQDTHLNLRGNRVAGERLAALVERVLAR